MTREEFIKKYGGIYEHSPWIAEAAYGAEGIEAIHAAMKDAVEKAGREQQLALVRAHPELGSKVKMAEASVREQSGAGLDRCSPEEYAEFRKLNEEYNRKFGFPFIIAVKGLTRQEILAAFRQRMHNSPEEEFPAALEQIHRIAWFRLSALDPEHL
jgi:2-oxo-4-hydroxy-4-carboxy-5-ureidoimidazoline decarboxylase